MIRNWLLKHRWFNETLKIITASIFTLFSYWVWEAGKLASAEIVATQSYKLMIFGVAVGLLGMVALTIILDVVCSIIGIIRKSN